MGNSIPEAAPLHSSFPYSRKGVAIFTRYAPTRLTLVALVLGTLTFYAIATLQRTYSPEAISEGVQTNRDYLPYVIYKDTYR